MNLQTPIFANNESENRVDSACVRLDGRCLFQIADFQTRLPERIADIDRNLAKISNDFFQSDSSKLQVEVQKENNLPVIYVNNQRLATITSLDLVLQAFPPSFPQSELV